MTTMPADVAIQTKGSEIKTWQRWTILLPAVAAILLYWPALKFGKVWDDWQLLGDFGIYRDPAMWRRALALPLPFSDNYFRPLVMLTYLLEGFAGSTNPLSHAINIGLHALNSVLVTLLALRVWPAMTYRRAAAVLVGMLYAVWPPLSEAAVWLAGRFDLMVVTMVLLGLLADAAVKRPSYRVALVTLAFMAAMFCKEMAAVMPIMLLGLRLARSEERLFTFLFAREQRQLYAGFAFALFVYVAVRYAALGYLATPVPAMAYLELGGALNRLLLSSMTFGGYVHMLLMPLHNVHPQHFTDLPIATDNAMAWLGLAELAALAMLVLWLYRLPRWRFLACGLGATALCFGPVLHLTPVPMLLGNAWLADRASALPLVMYLLAMGSLLALVKEVRIARLAGLVAAAWLGLSMLVVHSLMPMWDNDLVLWSWVTQETPRCSPCHANFATYLVQAGELELAMMHADLGVKYAAQPWQVSNAHSTRANVLVRLERNDEALAELTQAQAAEPALDMRVRYEMQRAWFLIKMKRNEEAQAALARAVQMGGGVQVAALSLVAELALASDRPDVAREVYKSPYANSPRAVLQAKLEKTNDPDQWARLRRILLRENDVVKAAAAKEEEARLRALKQ